MNTEAYLMRLGVARPARPDSAALATLQAAHQRAVPFENLDVWKGVTLDLDPGALFDKIVGRGRGGFCYELNSLFARLLAELGFDVDLMSAGVYDEDGRCGPPFDHMCLRVITGDGPWLCDVGFGRAALRPLPLRAAETIEDPVANFRLRTVEEARDGFGPPVWSLAREAPGNPRSGDDGWMPLYDFDLKARSLDEFAPMCAWHQKSADSIFPRQLVLSRATATGRVSVRGMEWIREVYGRREAGQFSDEAQRNSFIRNEFGLHLD